MQQFTGVTFQSSLAPVPVAPTKGLASMHVSILQSMLLLYGYTSAELATQQFSLFGCEQFIGFFLNEIFVSFEV